MVQIPRTVSPSAGVVDGAVDLTLEGTLLCGRTEGRNYSRNPLRTDDGTAGSVVPKK